MSYKRSGMETNMVRVLCIGQYNEEGKFVKRQWESFFKDGGTDLMKKSFTKRH